ncbi:MULTISPECIES: ImmA/IrrE family metallo-endopeptidase [Hydrogenibacillus]|uniref:HigA protein (Antitoxin to HigB) n=1 Tax=Hydrogenibacillus schlegelii TaxID=1484 RepID=A0A2T5G3P3_HYDSH|nr:MULTISPECIES: ImmA/IrrE family metallo-endopeptidase [Hydrogenibacillus]PTQ50772.1 MAG: HigA protein (antitoxin to HigB) [Hydrogenibacillus schlegelii]QZA33266.1 ImmA/IrrE family metallo-endopeptidase [Hydrogenibacillus sp. N12]
MVRVDVRPDLIRWAIKRSQKREELYRKFRNLSEWERGTVRPTLRQLEEFAKATATPFGYFFLPEPPEEVLPIPFFRTVERERVQKPSPDLLETIYTLERRQEWMHEYLIEKGYEPLPFVGSAVLSDDPVETAREMRRVLDLNEGWASRHRTWTGALRALQDAAENAGIVVSVNSVVGTNNFRRLDPEEFRGFVLIDEYVPFIFVNGADAKAAQMFTLAHELAHIWIGKSAVFDLRDLEPADDPVERQCNRIAAEFLVPSEELKSYWPEARQEKSPLQAVARKFKVSEIVAARRALDLGLIDRETFFRFYRDSLGRERRAKREEDGGQYYYTQIRRLGRRFVETVVRAARAGDLLYHEAFRLTGIYGDTFEKLAARVSGERL